MRASTMRLRRPTFLPSTTDRKRLFGHRAACTAGSRRTRRPRLRRTPLVTYELHQNRREPRFRAARRARVARVMAAPRRAPCALLLPLVRQVLPQLLWASRSGEPVLARPAGCDGRMGSREWLCEAALGDAGSQRTSSSLYYKRVASAGSRARDSPDVRRAAT